MPIGSVVVRVSAVIALIAGPALAATYADLKAKADASLQIAEKAGAKIIQPVKDPDVFLGHSGWQEGGGIVFYPDMAEVLIDKPPTNADVLRRPWTIAAQGETTGLVVGAWAVRKADTVMLRAQIVDEKGKPAARMGVVVRPVVFAPVAQRGQKAYRMQGLWLAEPSAVQAGVNHALAWFLRVEVGPDARPGEYRLEYRISWENEDPATAPRDSLRFTVLPVKLADPASRNYTFGVFCAGADFNEAQFRQMKEHGIESILWFWGHYGMTVRNENGKLKLDFAELDKTVQAFQAAGMRGPLVMALGNDSAGHLERRIAEAFDLPMQPRVVRDGKEVKLASLEDPRIEQRLVEALTQLFEHAKASKWPEIVIMPYDEPTERLMAEHKRMVKIFRQHFPSVRLYGCTMNRLAWAKMLDDTDILVSNGDFGRIIQFARENNKTSWFYGGIPAALGHNGCRASYGLAKYAYHPDGSWFWSYNFHVQDPWNDFDGGTPDSAWVICWPPLEDEAGSISTLGYEGIRAGVNDVRYAMTLEDALKTAKGPAAEQVGRQYESWRQQAQQKAPSAAEIDQVRLQMVEWLLQASGKPLPKGLEKALAAASRPAATQPAGFQEVENEQE